MEINKAKVYERYNKLLLRQLRYFIDKNQDLLASENFEKEELFLENLQNELKRSAVIRKEIPVTAVPTIKIYKEIYSKLFEDKMFGRKSYFNILKKYLNTKKITADEKVEKELKSCRENIIKFLKTETTSKNLNILSEKFNLKKGSNIFLRLIMTVLILSILGGQVQSVYGQTTNSPKQQELVQEKNDLNLNKEELNKLNELLGKLEFGENKFQTTEGKKIFVNKLKMNTGNVKIEFNGNAGSFSISSFPYLNIDSTGIIKLIPPFLDMMKFQLEKKGESEENIQKVINKMYSKIYEEKQINKIINGIIITK